MFKELKEIILKELKETMVLIKESLQGNEKYKNLPTGNSQTEKFSNRIEIFRVGFRSVLEIAEESVNLKADL